MCSIGMQWLLRSALGFWIRGLWVVEIGGLWDWEFCGCGMVFVGRKPGKKFYIILMYLSILLFKRFLLFGILFFFLFKNTPIPLYLSGEKTKGQYDKNTILTHPKTLPKK